MSSPRFALRTLLLASLASWAALAGCGTSHDRLAPAAEMAPAGAPAESAARTASYDPAATRALDTTRGNAPPTPGMLATPAAPDTIAALSAIKLIRTGSLTIEVTSAADAAERIEELAVGRGGYVSEIQGSRGGDGMGASAITIRVPNDQFQPALKALRALGTVERESVSTQDVGREYADIEARLGTKRAVADRMREILSTKTASLQDLFEAERQLAIVLEEIERLEGQRRYFDHQVALSTITASVHEPAAVVTTVAAVATLPPFLQPAREALLVARGHLSELVGVATYLVVVVGPWLILAALGWMLARSLRRRGSAAAT